MFNDIKTLRPSVLLGSQTIFARLYKKLMMISSLGWFGQWYFNEAYAFKRKFLMLGA